MDEIRIGKTPISEDCPAGTDTRYEPAFEELQTEIDKLSSPSAIGGVDWQRISNLSEKILSEESKDLLVASYFAVSRIYIEELPGLTRGTQVLQDLLENFWDTMFPKKKRMRGRVAAIEWWVEKSATAIELLGLQSIEESFKTATLADCENLNQLFQDHFPEPPAISILTRVIVDLPVVTSTSVPELQKQEQPPVKNREPSVKQAVETQTPVEQNVPPAPEPFTPQPTNTSDDALKAIQTLNENLKRTALSLIEHDLANPIGHRSLRTAIWSDLDSLPQAVDGRTIIPSPEPHILPILQDLASRGDWKNLVSAAENHFAQYIFWLDLHRYCAIGLEHLGRSYEKAYDAVCLETASFLGRMSGLSSLQFADGLPFADEETVEWCQNLSSGGNAMNVASSIVGTSGTTEATEKLNTAIQQAGELVKDQKLTDAVRLLQSGIQGAPSAREAMQWRLTLVQTLMSGKKAEIALSHCEKLTLDVEYYNLERWDPEQALIIYKTFYYCLKKSSSKLFKERGEGLLNKIAGLDSAEAIMIS